MGDFYVDDQFYDHPKVLHAGEEAANLYVRGLAWAHRHNTALIPKNALAALTSRPAAKKVAAKLTETAPGHCEPLWHDEGSHYRIHDWEVRNAKSIARREAGKKGAHAKWDKYRESQKEPDGKTDAIADVCQKQNGADPLPNQPRNQGTKEQAAAGFPAAAADVISEAFEILYQRRPPARTNPAAHHRVVFEALAAQYAAVLAGLDWGTTDWTADRLAEHLEPKPHLTVVPDTTRRDYAHVRPDCPEAPAGCGGSGMILAYDGSAQRCPMCNPVRARA